MQVIYTANADKHFKSKKNAELFLTDRAVH